LAPLFILLRKGKTDMTVALRVLMPIVFRYLGLLCVLNSYSFFLLLFYVQITRNDI